MGGSLPVTGLNKEEGEFSGTEGSFRERPFLKYKIRKCVSEIKWSLNNVVFISLQIDT